MKIYIDLIIIICFLEVQSKCYAQCHNHQVDQTEWHQIFPLEGKHLVDAHAWISPAYPDEQERHEECLAKEPYYRWNEVHNGVEAFPSGHVKRHPATQEHKRCDTRHDEEVQILCQVEESEVDTRILGVVTGVKLVL